jgi:hypothetical protein
MRKVKAIYGVDFSGAQDAGNKIWIARGINKDGKLLMEECVRGRELLNLGNGLVPCLDALVNLIKSNPNAVFGFDFPFGVPHPLVKENSWEEFVLAFPERYESPEAFREACRQAGEGQELKRRTDMESRAPFSPYNLRICKQTYYGINEVLRPLVRDRSACVFPFQEPADDKPWILEVCPACTLRSLGLNGLPYKVRSEVHKRNRLRILEKVQRTGSVQIGQPELTEKIIANKDGDALDSVIAAMVVFKILEKNPVPFPMDPVYLIEGYIYW